MRILTLDAALARCSAAVVRDGAVIAALVSDVGRGQPAALPPMAESVLREAGLSASALDLVAVTVGPGGFTGIRAALSLAHGIGLAAAIPVAGVTVGEALTESAGRPLWVALDSRRGQVFLERPNEIRAFPLDALPLPDGPVALAGDAAPAVAALFEAAGVMAELTPLRLPEPAGIAAAVRRRRAGGLPPLAAQPLYVDPPAVHPPSRPPRPPPQ